LGIVARWAVFHDIEVSLKPEMEEAQELLTKVRRRELYPFIGESVIQQGAATRKQSDEWDKIVTDGVFAILEDRERLEQALREYGNCSDSDRLSALTEVRPQSLASTVLARVCDCF
jgi:hypothetical protein